MRIGHKSRLFKGGIELSDRNHYLGAKFIAKDLISPRGVGIAR
jgi:hypothetical protein